MVSDTLRFTANDKDVSLALEMTTQESAVPHSLEAPNPQPLIPSYQSLVPSPYFPNFLSYAFLMASSRVRPSAMPVLIASSMASYSFGMTLVKRE